MPPDDVIVTEGLCKDFGEIHAVCGVDLRVARGQILSLLGPNGAGKTTTIAMLSCLLAPTAAMPG
jgi:ABC-2 type transport system ATP-binding protein